MRRAWTKLKAIVAAIAAGVTLSLPLAAETIGSERETELLAALALAEPAEAKRVERELRAIWSNSGSPSMNLLLKRGRDAMETQNFRTAIEHLTALTDHAPDFAEGWSLRAQAFFASELYGPALADLERALALNPNNYDAIYGLGLIFEMVGDMDRAYESFQRAQAIHPHHEDISTAIDRLRPHVRGTSL